MKEQTQNVCAWPVLWLSERGAEEKVSSKFKFKKSCIVQTQLLLDKTAERILSFLQPKWLKQLMY